MGLAQGRVVAGRDVDADDRQAVVDEVEPAHVDQRRHQKPLGEVAHAAEDDQHSGRGRRHMRLSVGAFVLWSIARSLSAGL